MRAALRATLKGEGLAASHSTSKALLQRELIDKQGALTTEGWVVAVRLVPLKEQCGYLGIEYSQIDGLDFKGAPERAAYQYYQTRGYLGGYCEGGVILLLIRSAALPVLARLNTFGSRRDACTRFTEAQLTIHTDRSEEILAAISKASHRQVKRRFREIYSHSFVRETYPGLSAESITKLFRAIGAETLTRITSAMMKDPYRYRSGWPDLTMTNNNHLLWCEIKTTDKLHDSQISTLRHMRSVLPGSIGVTRLR